MLQYVAIILIMLGLYGLLTQRNVIKIIISLNVLEIGLNIFIISVGYVTDGVAPIFTSTYPTNAVAFVDPLPQALVLTAIVIGVGTTALGLALAKNIYNQYGTFDLDEIKGEE
ncbi:sodium:proton antiporter [Candidatus Xianfuyuplasma coldseepsis]|uniref:Cation:proton antiporter subunit C n=1 Tax=Candidatus Xianfuyuplasma coldseepsis TaxID=2782163 RepID=A0A7L7KT86_9MOLU|nr:cation:proton antiporter subunit C [Xianfuyuplasma coldseepsis]QMS85953.1 cation:proton antiporter subunit C [Xianfuyuplasma coldseepsis]